MTIDVSILDEYFKIKSQVKMAAEEKEDSKDESEKSSSSADILNVYLAYLRASFIIHQHGHWKCKCPQFYANHLLFERIYDSFQTLSDETAEKIIGIFGNDSLKHDKQCKLISDIASDYCSDNHIENSLNVVKAFLQTAKKTYDSIKENGDMSLGLDDMIMSHASKAEEAVYLLSQINQ
jgi:DNA-binding ferritin-like protein